MAQVRYLVAYTVRDVPVARDALRDDHPQPIRDRGFASKTGLDVMPVEMTENRDVSKEEPGRVETRSPAEGVSIEEETRSGQTTSPPDRQSRRWRRLLTGVLGALVLAAAGVFGIPWIRAMLNTVSTDDA